MAQQPTRFCSNCGTPLAAGQRFCSSCGATTDSDRNNPTELGPTHSTGPGAMPIAPITQAISPSTGIPPLAQNIAPQLTPPPPPDVYVPDPYSSPPLSSQRYQSPVQGSQSSPGDLSLQGYQPSAGSSQVVPDFARPQKPGATRRGGSLRIIVLLLIVLLGIGGFLAYRLHPPKNPLSQIQTKHSETDTTHTSTSTTSTSNSSSSTSGPLSAKTITFPKPLSFIYDDVQLSIIDVKQAENFPDDDRSAAQSGVLRIDLKEQNTYSSYSSYYPSDAFSLLSPDGTTAKPVNTNQSGLDADISRTNWLDFAIASNIDVSTLKLQVGSSTEEQIIVPLKANADLSKYQPKVANLNQSTQYGGMTWTATQAETRLSSQGKQADAGKIFVTVTFKIDNNSAADFTGLASEYMRLQSGQVTNQPINNNIPTTISAQQTGQTGTATFVMPKESTDFTLLLLASNHGSVYTSATQQATIQFQIR